MAKDEKIRRKPGRPKGTTLYNWEGIRADYESGSFSVDMLKAKYGPSSTAITKRANLEGWSISSTSKLVSRRTIERIIRPDTSLSREDAIEAAVETNARIIREHRGITGRGRALALRLIGELEDTMDNLPAFETLAKAAADGDEKLLTRLMNRLDIGNRAVVLKDIATATRTWVELERVAFNLDGEKEDDVDRWTDERLDKRISELLGKGRTDPAA